MHNPMTTMEINSQDFNQLSDSSPSRYCFTLVVLDDNDGETCCMGYIDLNDNDGETCCMGYIDLKCHLSFCDISLTN
ncbi:unnamed protein product [Rotaria magnacalcarata]|uniref:Uncharacterized protein n=1 Tax=Rotaria magnacalcarata TaxID=392030 RepID=A0A8S3GUH2_9BILA|nr:unnamed protein product [Rotaria magnacalcarata]